MRGESCGVLQWSVRAKRVECSCAARALCEWRLPSASQTCTCLRMPSFLPALHIDTRTAKHCFRHSLGAVGRRPRNDTIW
jgi:hypothetical protein